MSLINMLSTKPSKIINVKKGTLKKGSAADITVFDPNRYFTFLDNILSKSLIPHFLIKDLRVKFYIHLLLVIKFTVWIIKSFENLKKSFFNNTICFFFLLCLSFIFNFALENNKYGRRGA